MKAMAVSMTVPMNIQDRGGGLSGCVSSVASGGVFSNNNSRTSRSSAGSGSNSGSRDGTVRSGYAVVHHQHHRQLQGCSGESCYSFSGDRVSLR